MASRLLSFRAIATMLALTAVVSSCSDDDDDNTATPTTGVNWTVDGSTVAAGTTQAARSGNTIEIDASSAANQKGNVISLVVPTRTGSFTLSDTTETSATYVTVGADTTVYFGASGNVVVSSYTRSTTAGASSIAGTYNFTGISISPVGTKNITNGTFNLKF